MNKRCLGFRKSQFLHEQNTSKGVVHGCTVSKIHGHHGHALCKVNLKARFGTVSISLRIGTYHQFAGDLPSTRMCTALAPPATLH